MSVTIPRNRKLASTSLQFFKGVMPKYAICIYLDKLVSNTISSSDSIRVF